MNKVSALPSKKNKNTAVLLAMFLGGLGVHQFYMGRWIGIFYIMFFPISCLVGIVEGFIILAKPTEEWESDLVCQDVNSKKSILIGVGVIVGSIVISVVILFFIGLYVLQNLFS